MVDEMINLRQFYLMFRVIGMVLSVAVIEVVIFDFMNQPFRMNSPYSAIHQLGIGSAVFALWLIWLVALAVLVRMRAIKGWIGVIYFLWAVVAMCIDALFVVSYLYDMTRTN